ncbi:recombinase family protein [Dongshaea marina]|uniref:recombinase family protein n=1 Tax=Dongshaea marina TaxID=2047966 RepID=UPI000D3EE171|nr:recombinase family protein [Dongshaea marina]
MFIRAYLRASTDEQDSERARQSLDEFVNSNNQKIASYYIENQSGAVLDRPELQRLLRDTQKNDVLLVEQIDRLTRLNDSDWKSLKKMIDERGLRIVSLDIPTSWTALESQRIHGDDPVTKAVLAAINNMLIDLMAAMARKDYLTRQSRQKQGIIRAKSLGKYQGRAPDTERHQKVIYYRRVKKLSITETADATGYSRSQVCRIQKKHELDSVK